MSLRPNNTRREPHLRAVGLNNDQSRGFDAGHVKCSCSTTIVPSPAGEIIVLRVAGELDHTGLPIVAAALDEVLERRPRHLVVDLAGVSFCSARGHVLLLVKTKRDAAATRTGYALSAVSRQMARVATLLWPETGHPTHYPTAASAVLSALAGQTDPRRPGRASRPTLGPADATSPPALNRASTGSGRYEPDTDQQLVDKSRAGDAKAYQALAHRHRNRMWHSALRTLEISDDPDEVTFELVTHLCTGLAAFDHANPP